MIESSKLEISQAVPIDTKLVIGTENVDFSVIGKRNQRPIDSFGLIAFGFVFIIFCVLFIYISLEGIFNGQDVYYEADGVETLVSFENFDAFYLPLFIISLFILTGLGILAWGIYSIFRKGGQFVGTATRLLYIKKNKIKSYEWEQFTGIIEIDNKRKSISLQLKTGTVISSRSSADIFENDVVYISGIPNFLEIEKICRKRIRENVI